MNLRPCSWKEARRRQAWHRQQQGWSPRQIAEALGVSAGAVSPWLRRARQGGAAALRARPSPGAPRRLTPAPLTRLPTFLACGPDAAGFRGQIGTRKRVAEVMHLECGVVSHPTHGGRLLHAIRRRPQKPMRRARQRDEAALAHWREEPWPVSNKGHKASRTASSSAMHRASLPCLGWCAPLLPGGRPPLERVVEARSGVSPRRGLARGTVVLPQAGACQELGGWGAFLAHLRREVPGPLVLMGDGTPSHRRQPLQQVLTHGAAPRLQLDRLPAYAPALYPGEGLWGQRQGGEWRHVCGVPLSHLQAERREGLTRVRRTSRIISGVCRGAHLSIVLSGSGGRGWGVWSMGATTGRVKDPVAPWCTAPSAQSRPPCRWMRRCTVARPRPGPGHFVSRCRRWNAANHFSTKAMSHPAPFSRTHTTDVPSGAVCAPTRGAPGRSWP
jgi:transposase